MPLILMDLHVRISGMALELVSVGLARSHAQIFQFRPLTIDHPLSASVRA